MRFGTWNVRSLYRSGSLMTVVVWYGGMDWIDMAQDRDRWQAFVSVVMNLRVP
jgi:hypothetical protein